MGSYSKKMKNPHFQMSKITIKIGKMTIRLYMIITVVCFCIMYALVIHKLLPDNYVAGVYYENRFSAGILMLCIIDAILLYLFTESAITSSNLMLNYTIRIIYWVYAIPMSVYPALFNPKYVWPFWWCFNAYWVLLCFIAPKIHLSFLKMNGLHYSNKIKRLIGIASIFVLIFLIIKQLNNFQFSLSLEDVYDVRQEYKEQMSQSVIGIFRIIFGTYICLCIIVLLMKERKYAASIVFVFLQLVLFSMAKDKIMLIYLMMALVIGCLSRQLLFNINKSISIAIFATCGLLCLAIIGFFSEMIFSLVARRMFFMPAWGNYLWYEFFTDHSKLWLHQDVFLIDKLFSPIYPKAAPALIAALVGGGEYSYFNTGLMAEAYSQLGVIGFVFGPIVIGFWMELLNQFYKNKSPFVQLMLSFSLSQAIINSTLIETSNIFIFIAIMIYSGVFPNVRNEPVMAAVLSSNPDDRIIRLLKVFGF